MQNQSFGIVTVRSCDKIYMTGLDTSPMCHGCTIGVTCQYTYPDFVTKQCTYNKYDFYPNLKLFKPEEACYDKSREATGKKYDLIQYKKCIYEYNRLLVAKRYGYCTRLYRDTQNIKGQECHIIFFYQGRQKKIHSIYCNGNVKYINPIPTYLHSGCTEICGHPIKQDKNNNYNGNTNNKKQVPNSSIKNNNQTNKDKNNLYNKNIRIEDGDQNLIKKLENCGSECKGK